MMKAPTLSIMQRLRSQLNKSAFVPHPPVKGDLLNNVTYATADMPTRGCSPATRSNILLSPPQCKCLILSLPPSLSLSLSLPLSLSLSPLSLSLTHSHTLTTSFTSSENKAAQKAKMETLRIRMESGKRTVFGMALRTEFQFNRQKVLNCVVCARINI